uniref:Palmitoyltransferase n=2 Tax=Panagrolaimus sp. JU765 TaxID=591449 RepID=A0AC34PZD6_9BILA
MEFEENSFKHIRSVDDAVHRTKKVMRRLQPQDITAILIVLVVLPLGFIFEVTYVVSFFHEFMSDEWLMRVIPLTYCGLNVLLNLWKLVSVGPNGKTSDLPSVQKPGFRYCHSCNVNSPPRAYHCPVCDTCIMRRDHHCSFGATCIGHFNQRYFVAAIINVMIIALVVLWYNFLLIFVAIPNIRGQDFWVVCLPHLALVLGQVTLYQFFVLVTFAFSVLGQVTLYQFFVLVTFAFSGSVVIFDSYLISAQLFCLYRGQTRMEYLLDIHAYNCGFLENLRQALGRRWPLIVLSPFIPSPLDSDGISFKTHEMENISKSTKNL